MFEMKGFRLSASFDGSTPGRPRVTPQELGDTPRCHGTVVLSPPSLTTRTTGIFLHLLFLGTKGRGTIRVTRGHHRRGAQVTCYQ
ncbi:hypothetical protein GN956_G21809 [Arapaima gigas]